MADIDSGFSSDIINKAEGKELFESLFANAGSRETISIRDWIDGWSAIVGGINGIPTSRQFNTLQYISDLKSLLLYNAVVALQQAGSMGIKIGPQQELEKNMILFETLKGSNKIIRVRWKDSEGDEQVYDLAAIFEMAKKRETIQSGDTLSVLFGKILRYLNDLKSNCFIDADDPFTLMTEATYKPPSERAEGCLYALITDKRGIIINFYDRYIEGVEDPTIDRTLYGIVGMERTKLPVDENSYIGILGNIVNIKDGEEIERHKEMLYAINKSTK